jgi:HEPN domain-containing protein
MTSDEKYEYWLDIARYDLDTAEAMFLSKRWLYVVFMCQQAIEKLSKGLYILYIDDNIPRIHDIAKIINFFVDKLPISVEDDTYTFFERLTSYYLNNRYPEYREKTSSLLNESEAKLILDSTKEAFAWLLTLKP